MRNNTVSWQFRSRKTATLTAFATVALASIPLASCFSEKTATGPLPLTGECTIPTSAAGTVIILIRNFTFIPDQVTVKRGTKVSWVNCETAGSDSHTSTSDTGIWDSPSIQVGAAWTRTFDDAPGTDFNYHCVPHAFMKGTVNVE
ncbi:MAG TPA: plastocyanin/azurin family copper-binding protein [Gemmatimonadaceae bacterium]|nr:plastocyanin/azurin family copper-binding protein [Gemmatimonadaceae bacterium]